MKTLSPREHWDAIARSVLIIDEGFKTTAYQDTRGYWTIGVGHLIGKHVSQLKLSNNVVLAILNEDLKEAWAEVVNIFGEKTTATWTLARQMALLSLSFNLGGPKLRGFVKTIAAIRAANWDEAASQLESSLWASQVGNRSARIVFMVRTGRLHPAYSTSD